MVKVVGSTPEPPFAAFTTFVRQLHEVVVVVGVRYPEEETA